MIVAAEGAYVTRGFKLAGREVRPGDFLDKEDLSVLPQANLAALAETGFLETTRLPPSHVPAGGGRKR